MYRSHLYVSRQSYITPLRRSTLRVGDLEGIEELLDSLYRNNLANETMIVAEEMDRVIQEEEGWDVTRTWSKSTDWLRIRCKRSRTADSTTARVGTVGLNTHHLVAPNACVLGGSASLN